MTENEDKHQLAGTNQLLGKRVRDTEEDKDDTNNKRHKSSDQIETKQANPQGLLQVSAPKGFLDAQGGVALMLFDEETQSDRFAWYVVPQDVFCAGIEPIAKKFGPLIGRSTTNMFAYLAEITDVFPYPEEDQDGDEEDEEESEDDDQEEDQGDDEKKEGQPNDCQHKHCPDCYKRRESAALFKLIDKDWAKYVVPNTIKPASRLPLAACKVRIFNALYTYSLAVNEHDE
jgi:hypothetical protein